MKKTKLTRSLLAACSVVALSAVMYGCTSDGAENDLVATEEVLGETATDLKEAQDRIAALEMELETAKDNVTTLTTDLGTATGTITDLETTIGDMGDAADENGSLHAQINYHTGEASRLSGEIGDMSDAADAAGSLHAQINYHMGEASRLSTEAGDMSDAADAAGSLHARINYHMGEASRLSTEAGDASDAAAENGSLHAQINYHMGDASTLRTMIGDPSDPADSSADASLHAQLNFAKAYAGSPDDPADDSETASLHAQLNAAKARIMALEEGTADDVLGPIKTAASTAATAAGDASTAAGEAADEAGTAAENRATVQTGEANSVADAMAARTAADKAADEAKTASDASDMAQAATNANDARPYTAAAETAQGNAEDAQEDAETARDDAVADAMVELKIDGKTKSVGEKTITVGDDTHTDERTINGVTTTKITGKVETLMTDGAEIDGKTDDPLTTDVTEPDIPGAEARADITIGGRWDSAEDDARLALVTAYAGTQTVTAFTDTSGETRSGTKQNVVDEIDHDGVPETALRTLPLRRAAGTFMAAPGLGENDDIAATTMASAVYYYETTTGKVYVRPTGSSVTGTGTNYSYQVVGIRAGAKIPKAANYGHLHFGLWTDLKTIDSVTGDNALDSLGIGFVTALADGDGMTEEMPNHGDARYSGNWVAAIQALDDDGDGDIIEEEGTSEIEANFRSGSVEIDLEGFVTLDGKIEGNRFSGSYADAELDFADVDNITGGVQALGSLNATGEYHGTINGAFFGDNAEEVGGVFDFTSTDNEDGAFRGAFGAHEDEDVDID